MKTKRFITGIILVLCIFPLISFPALLPLFEGVMVLFVLGAINEFLHMFESKTPLTKNFKWIISLLTVLIYFALAGFLGFNQGTSNQSEVIHFALSFVIVVLFIYFVASKNFSVDNIGKALLVMVYVAFGAAAITSLRFMGVRFIVYMILISTLTDTFAYIVGMKFGKHKMAPIISPKKSWEGAIGGTIVATILASLFGILYGFIFSPGTELGALFNSTGELTILDRIIIPGSIPMLYKALMIIVMTLSASIVSQFGDLMASKLKRHYEIKDFGQIFPGHGGIMDRFDSVIMVSLYLFSILNILNLIG